MIKKSGLCYILLCLALVINLAVGYSVYAEEDKLADNKEVLEKISVMMQVLHLIQHDYVNPEDVDYSSLIYNALDGMVSSLGPHSSFLQPQEYESMKQMTEGKFGGIGIVVTMKEGVLTIITPIEGTPGSEAGLMAGDQIIAVDGKEIEGTKLSKIVNNMKGEPGTDVTLKIYRPETDETMEKTITRDIVEVPSVKGAHMYDSGIGYVRITQFDEHTASDLEEQLQSLDEQGMKSLVIDVRNNPGGLLKAAVDTCSKFLGKDKMVVYTKGRRSSQDQKYFTDNGVKFLDIPIVILVNEGSASAAEILAGCLQDYERAVLVGVKTFGKGSVQNIIRLPDDSALRLTTAMYYTPSERVIKDNGIKPDIQIKLTKEQKEKFRDEVVKLGRDKPLKPDADPQLKKALEVLRNKAE